MVKRLFISSIISCCALMAGAWSQKGHDVTAFIAEQHLTPTTQAAVDSILDGKSLVYWCNWLDNASHTMPYAYTKTWHYKNVDADDTYESAPANPAGDAVTALKQQYEQLASKSLSKQDAALALKIIVHVMGDLHQPMHMGHATDLGGNRTKVKYFDRDTNLHSVWDSSLVESAHKWSYTEWQQQVDRESEAVQHNIVSGWFDDWAKETMKIADQCYAYFQPNCKISYDAIANWTPVIEQQFLRGGLRLAHVLNLIFDADYSAQLSGK